MSSRLLLLLIILVVPTFQVWAGGDPFPMGARAWGLANAASTFEDGWALWNNAAGIARLKSRQFLTAYDIRYNMPGLQTMALGYIHPLPKGVAGISMSRLGDDLYHENTLSLAYSYPWEKISLGARVNYLQAGMAEIGVRHAFTIEIGVRAQLLPELTLGAHIYNVTQSRFGLLTPERVPIVMKAGLAYQPSAKVTLVTEVQKDIDFPATINAGLEYEIVRNLRFRTGVGARPQLYAFGVGFSPKKLQIDYAIRTHPVLGLSHHLSLNLELRKKKNKELPGATDTKS